MAKRSMALDYLLLAVPGMGSNLAGDSVSFLHFHSLPVTHSSAKPVEIKSSITFIQSNSSIDIDIIMLKIRPQYIFKCKIRLSPKE